MLLELPFENELLRARLLELEDDDEEGAPSDFRFRLCSTFMVLDEEEDFCEADARRCCWAGFRWFVLVAAAEFELFLLGACHESGKACLGSRK